MKPQFLKVTTAPTQSFSVRRDIIPFLNNTWHYHAELELIHLEKGTGTQFVGDSITAFKAGDLVLIGSNLPHFWRFDEPSSKDYKDNFSDITVTHFHRSFWGQAFLELPENKSIRNLLDRANTGIQIVGETRRTVITLMKKMLSAESSKRLMLLLEILNIISSSRDIRNLSSRAFVQTAGQSENYRISAILEYSYGNYRNKISIEEIASVANMSPNSFCRYFKTYTGKTYSNFLLEYRVGMACKLLIDGKLSIQQICYESGFNNSSSFHKYFKKITGKSPLIFQKEFNRKKYN